MSDLSRTPRAGSGGTFAMDALRESEERFRNVFVQAPLPQALASIDGWHMVAGNSQFCDLLGYDAVELLSRRLNDLTHPQDWPRHLSALHSMLGRPGEPAVVEKRYLHRDGDVRHVRSHLQVIRDDAGAPRYVHAVSVDITGQREAEQALAATRERLRALIEHTRDLVLVLGPDGAVRSVDPEGGPAAAALTRPGASVFDLVEPTQAGPLHDAMASVLLEGRTRRLAIQARSAGRLRHWDVRLRRDAGGEVVAVCSDITDRVRAEQLHEGEAALLRRLVSGAPRGELLDQLARLMEAVLVDMRVSVLLVDGGRLMHGAAPSMTLELVEATNAVPVAPGAGPWGAAAFRGEPVIVEDVRDDPLVRDDAQALDRAGVRSCWSMPIHGAGGTVAGAFAMFGAAPGRPDPEQWRLTERLASLAGLIIAGAAPSHASSPAQLPAAAAPRPAARSALDVLTDRERQVLRLLALGHTNEEMAAELYLSLRTVEAHRAALFRKLRTRRRADLVRLALAGDLLNS